MSSGFHRFLAILLLFWAPATAIQASTEQKLSLDQLAADADVIIRGRVDKIAKRQASDRRPSSTVIQISVERQFKGPKLSTLSIEQPGGADGDVVLAAPGSPEFSPGEQVLLFVKQGRQRGAFNVVGGKQGKFTVGIDPESGKEVVEDVTHRTEPLESFTARLQK
jgi:hypothetical protein